MLESELNHFHSCGLDIFRCLKCASLLLCLNVHSKFTLIAHCIIAVLSEMSLTVAENFEAIPPSPTQKSMIQSFYLS